MFKRFTRTKAFPLLVIFIVLLLFTMIYSSGVLKGEPIGKMFTTGMMSKANWLTNFYTMVIQVMMMVGLSCVLISGNFDLSLAGQATFGAQIFAIVIAQPWSNLFLAAVAALVAAILFGLCNAFLVNKIGLPAFIATMGMASVYTGLCQVVSGNNLISVNNPAFLAFGSKTYGPVPLMFIVAIVILIVFEIILFRTRFGRSLYMAGGNPTAARLCGLNPSKLRVVLFVVNSILAVFGGICWTAQMKMIHPTAIASSAPNMTATAAAILGGVSFGGGTGELLGPFVALMLINVFENMLNILAVSDYWVIVAQGLLLIVSLIIDYVGVRRREAADLAKAMSA